MSSLSLWKVQITGEYFTATPVVLDTGQKTLDEISISLPGGVYSTFRTYQHNKVLSLEKHFHRLDESSNLLGKPVKIDHTGLRNALHYILQNVSNKDLRIRLTVDLEKEYGAVYISTESLHVPGPEYYLNGGNAMTYQLQRPNPQAKQTSHLITATRLKSTYEENINEILMVSPEGIIQEGLSSNFYAVLNGTIWTANQGVLLGTIRSVVLDLAISEGIPVVYEGVNLANRTELDETFITSTSRSILPIVKIDECIIGSGKPGTITRKLMQRYQQFVEMELEVV